MKYKIIIYLLFFGAVFTGYSQGDAKYWELSSSLTGTKNYVARDYIKLKPGFKYTPATSNTFKASINEKMVCDIGSSGYLSPENQPPTSVNTTSVVGCTAGSASVNATGGATYNIPLFTSPGTTGMQPSISIAYNSQGSNGVLGKDWDIAGLSAIGRIAQTFYTDEKTGGINMDLNDRFALDGNRLLSLVGTYGNQGTTYETETMTFSKIETPVFSDSYYFKVSTKDGKIIEYGNSNDSRAVASGSTVPYMWRINKISDANKNYMTFSYRNENGESVIDHIDYTGNTNAGLPIYNQLQFYYERKDEKNTFYIANASIAQSLILRRITSICENKVVRTYDFDYTQNEFKETHLNKITETGSDGAKLNPTFINWGGTTVPYNDYEQTNFFDKKVLYSGDFNGDGRTDYFVIPKIYGRDYEATDTWQLYITNAGGQSFILADQGYMDGCTADSKFRGIEIADINRDGCDDIMFYYRYTNKCQTCHHITQYYLNGSQLTVYNNSINFITTADGDLYFLTGDFDGDSKTDYIGLYGNNNIAYGYFTTMSVNQNNFTFNFGSPDKVIPVDFNGDGIKDIMVIKESKCTIYTYKSASFSVLYSSGFPTKDHRIFPGDFNGDGKTDLLTYSTVSRAWQIAYSTGSGFTAPVSSLITLNFDPEADAYDHNYMIADYSGDGKSDILEFYHNWVNGVSNSCTINVYYSTGNSFLKEVATTTDNMDWILTGKYSYDKFDDLNGDGKADIFMIRDGLDKILTFHAYDQTGFVTKITNGFNQSVKFEYESLSTGRVAYTKGSGSQFPVNDIQGSLYVVKSMTIPDGKGSSSSTTYTYSGAKMHKQGLGFMGFTKVIAANSITNRKVTTTNAWDNTNYRLSSQSNTVAVYTTGEVISSTDYAFSNTRPVSGSKAWFTYPATITETNGLTGQVVSTANNYNGDVNGNVYTITKNYTGGFMETTKFENYTTAGSWIPNKPQDITVTRQHPYDAASFINKTHFTYNTTTGNLLTKTENANLAADKQVTTTYSNYDYFGHALSVNTTCTSEGGNVNLTNSCTYESKGRFIKTFTDPLMTTTYIYEPVFGNLVNEKLLNLTNPTTSVYDAWGRLISRTLPDGNTVNNTISWSSDIGAGKPLYYTYTNNSANSLWSKTYYDELGRVLKKESVGFNGISEYSLTQYKNTGQVDNQSSYLGSTKTSQVTYGYYLDGLIKSETNNITGATVDYKYTYGVNNIETIIDGKSYKKTFDNWGNLVQSDEPAPGGTIQYSYLSNGKPVIIKSPASTITIFYDALGQQTAIQDPDAGETIYRYDPMGRLTYQKDANRNETYQKYDSYNRIDHQENGSHAITYQYKYTTSGGGLGKIEQVTEKISSSTGTSISYTYDELGRLETTKKTIDASNVYSYTNDKYDQFGNILQTTYPGGNIVTNQYDQYGNLTKVLFTSANGTIKNSPVWTLNTLNATTMAYQLGSNGLTTTKQYDGSNFSLKSIVTAKGTTQIQSGYYDFNAVNGNLNSREDKRYALKETFSYDDIYRLTSWTVAKNGVTTSSNNMVYKTDQSGNIDFKADAGTYNYNIAGRPHQVGTVNLSTTSALATTPQNISYNTFGKVNVLSENNYELTFTYGPDQERCKSVMKQDIDILYTNYYAGVYEKKVMANGITTEYTYIGAGDGLAAIYIKTGSSGALYYAHKDHLGSIIALTDANGTLFEQYSYDPWGRRRNPLDWSFENISEPTLLKRGFTGHEHISELGLINMNGRVYDPVLGMFLSPDNYIQAPDMTQNHNRYAYCFNNPLKYTDPSGNFVPIFLVPSVSWSPQGGFGVSLTLGVGLYRGLSAQATVGYDFKGDNLYVSTGASYCGLTTYSGYGTTSGKFAGASFGFGNYGGFSSNILSVGINHSDNGGWGGNFSALQFDSHMNASFNPSISYSKSFPLNGHELYLEDVGPSDFERERDPMTNEEARLEAARVHPKFNRKAWSNMTCDGEETERYILDNKTKLYMRRNGKGSAVYGFQRGGKITLAPGVTQNNLMFESVTGHEYIHWCHSTMGLYKKFSDGENDTYYMATSDAVAYQYSENFWSTYDNGNRSDWRYMQYLSAHSQSDHVFFLNRPPSNSLFYKY